MSLSSFYLQQLYQGYLETNLLWNSNSIHGLEQLKIDAEPNIEFNRLISKKLRLGQLAEQFVFHQLEQTKHCNILAENLQIQSEKTTIGEIDTLIELEDQLYHVEVVYKFYLFDDSLGVSEIEKWIGPNRKDSLAEKLNKLVHKQLPLLYASETELILKQLKIPIQSIMQSVIFKAQLFRPYKSKVYFKKLNKACLSGFYININQLNDFADCTFYIPPKLDWFLEPHLNVEWLYYINLKQESKRYHSERKSPLIWIRKPNDTLLKCFLVWW